MPPGRSGSRRVEHRHVEEGLLTPAVLMEPGALEMRFPLPLLSVLSSGGGLSLAEPA